MDTYNPGGCRPLIEPEERKPARNGSTKRLSTPQGQALNFWSFPNDARERARLDALAQTPGGDDGAVLCWKAKKRCSNADCSDPQTEVPHRFSAGERALWNCPVCGKDRHCRNLTRLPNRGCHLHGGKTPTGFALPQTKTGEYSRHLRVGSLKADYERLRASETLCNTDEHIALLKAYLNQVVAQYGGGTSQALLQEMRKNRTAYKRELRHQEPNPGLLRDLDRELDQMIARGSTGHQVFEEFRSVVRDIDRLIAARDQHVHRADGVMTADRAWMLMAHVEQTFRVGAEGHVAVVDEDFVRAQCQTLGVDFEALSPTRVQELMQTYREQRQKEKRAMLTYASGRFRELAGTGLLAKSPDEP